MAATDTSLDKRSETIRDMFAGVAPRYDFLNHLLSGNLDVVWRRRLVRELALAPGSPVLDLCCGTGDQALALATRGAHVAAADFCVPMLAIARGKYRRAAVPAQRDSAASPIPSGLAADALALPFPDAHFAGATVSFGLRNVADLDQALRELRRVLRPGGRLGVLEFAVPEGSLMRRIYLFYFRHVLPRVGAILSPRASAYSYLPESVLEFPQRSGFVERMHRAGLVEGRSTDLTFGTVCLYQAVAP